MAEKKDFKSLSEEELKDMLVENKKKLMELEFKRKGGLDKPHQYQILKKEIAQILTTVNEKRREGGQKSR